MGPWIGEETHAEAMGLSPIQDLRPRDSGRRLAPVTCGSHDLGSRSLRKGPSMCALASEGFVKAPDHDGPRRPGNPAIDIKVSVAFDDRRVAGRIRGPRVRNDSSLARHGQRAVS